MENYTVNGKNYIADDGYIFKHNEKGSLYKKLRLAKNDSIDNYSLIIEPVIEEETNDTESSDI